MCAPAAQFEGSERGLGLEEGDDCAIYEHGRGEGGESEGGAGEDCAGCVGPVEGEMLEVVRVSEHEVDAHGDLADLLARDG